MDTPDTELQSDLFSIEQLEARFEMATLPPPGPTLHPAWSCTMTFNSK